MFWSSEHGKTNLKLGNLAALLGILPFLDLCGSLEVFEELNGVWWRRRFARDAPEILECF